MDNKDDVKVPGYNSITGKHIDNEAILKSIFKNSNAVGEGNDALCFS